jgi:mono/diheme cytochrome c family protein
MRIRAGVVSVVILFLVVFAMGCSKAEAPKPAATPAAPAVSAAAEGKALFEQKCGVCHGLDRATARQEAKGHWVEIVKTMQGKKADWISDADAAKIVEFLASEHGKK